MAKIMIPAKVDPDTAAKAKKKAARKRTTISAVINLLLKGWVAIALLFLLSCSTQKYGCSATKNFIGYGK